MLLKKSTVHSPRSDVYHTNEECPKYKRANKNAFKSGTGGKLHCADCAKLDEPGIKLSPENKRNLYAISDYLTMEVKEKAGLRISFQIYLQDPMVAIENPKYGIDEEFFIDWEPGIIDGPTSARFAVVDYNADTGKIAEPAQWNSKECRFYKNAVPLDLKAAAESDNLQFHQVNVWVVLQRAMMFFEDRSGMGRHIPWGFPGNRLIVVPHAGYGKNAFYERESKSLQFYYYEHEGHTIYTCLSSDIINHEFGHAILDGIRPYFYESTLIETGAFHEFVGDLTAILMVMRNNSFRKALSDEPVKDIRSPNALNAIAEQFGSSLGDRPYLRTATNELTMGAISDEEDAHTMSEVLTGTMFDILACVAKSYLKDRNKSWRQSLSYTIQKMQPLALQALDFLPPVDATFKDYGKAVLRSFELANPVDPDNYYGLILNSFFNRGIFTRQDARELKEPTYLKNRIRPKISYSVSHIASSRATAYRFLDDNRETFLIPANQDFEVVDLYDARKSAQDGRSLPKQTILQYLWKEEVELTGRQFGAYNGERTTIPCGGTIVFDANNTILFWSRKLGSLPDKLDETDPAVAESGKRRTMFLQHIAKRIKAGHVGAVPGSSKGMVGTMVTPLTVQKKDGLLTFQLSPHVSLAGNINEHFKGNKKWELSS